MPPRNAPLPNAVNLFNCNICDKGYPRQTDYENHLRSYDHNHRQRLAEMKKLTDANASDAPRLNKGPLDMRNIPQGDAAKKGAGLGPRFKKVGGASGAGAGAASTGGSRFRKIGEAKEEKVEERKEESPKVNLAATQEESVPSAEVEVKTQVETEKDEDVVMGDDDDEVVTWEEYDVTKPSECDHANCLGCQMPKNPVYENGWLVMGSA
ncbi:uncharacterized protein N0V89_008387 [Didymosphaeria variabile]|uniref:C2H2-type domain-containing protein n=1 Tax=Didymosphaeria variabile TaxID=1932322 RepID=A0A9W8XHH0_9PLEO|nr:uncharacterized protein N0V89_008387 [Didymosphaeria variabile]KAJ4349769.1 hypothetical protein N0V89_008387 [Didymosphaeria variabile]